MDALLQKYRTQLIKAIGHLEYSYGKISTLSPRIDTLATEQLEIWEGFVSRFARVSDLFLSKYVRTYVLRGDPAFRGSLRDFVDQAEKLGLVDRTETWMTIRELRNLATHEYSEEKLAQDLVRMKDLTPVLLALKGKLP